MKKILVLQFLVFAFLISANGQEYIEIFSSSGSNNADFIVTMGEALYEISSDENFSQNFVEVSYEITEVPELKKNNFAIEVFPNPTSDFVSLVFLDYFSAGNIKIYNLTGQCVFSEKVKVDLSIYIGGCE